MGLEAQSEEIAARFDEEIRLYIQRRRVAEAAEAEAKDRRQRADEQRDRLFDLLESAGIKTVNHELGRVTRTVRVKALVQDKGALMEWLEQNGMLNALTRLEVRQALLNEMVKERVEQGEDVPEGTDTLAIKGITFTARRK